MGSSTFFTDDRAPPAYPGRRGDKEIEPPLSMRWKDGKVSVTDGPFAETKEVLGGILILEAENLDHAVELMSKHPGLKVDPFEIRPAADLSEMIRASEQRRSQAPR